MTYHVVISKLATMDAWGIHFGDHDKEVAKQELEDARYGESHWPMAQRTAFRLITVPTAHQSAIDSALAKINAETHHG